MCVCILIILAGGIGRLTGGVNALWLQIASPLWFWAPSAGDLEGDNPANQLPFAAKVIRRRRLGCRLGAAGTYFSSRPGKKRSVYKRSAHTHPTKPRDLLMERRAAGDLGLLPVTDTGDSREKKWCLATFDCAAIPLKFGNLLFGEGKKATLLHFSPLAPSTDKQEVGSLGGRGV